MNATIDGVDVQLLQAPGFSYSIMDFIDSSKVKGNRATTIEVVATNDARRVLGSRQQSERASKEHEVIIGTPGAIYWRSRIRPVRWTADAIECEAVGGNGEWIEQVKGQKLKKLDWGASETVVVGLQRSSWEDTNTILHFPLIDYGSFEDRTNTYDVEIRKLRPAPRVWRVLTQAFGEMGLTIKARGAFAGFWKKLILPNVKDDLQVPEYILRGNDARFTTPVQTITPTGTTTTAILETDVVTNDPGGNYTVPFRYTSQLEFLARIEVNMRLNANFAGNAPRTTSVQITRGTNTVVVSQVKVITATSVSLIGEPLDYVLENVPLIPGEVYFIRWSITTPPSTEPTFIELRTVGTTYEPTSAPYQENAPVLLASTCPDMTTAELIKDLVSLFDLVVTTDPLTGVVYFETYEGFLLGIERGSDWRGREDQPTQKEQPPIPSRDSWAWAPDANDEELQQLVERVPDPGYGNADYIPEHGWDKPVEIKMTFAATAMINIFGFVFVPCMRKEDGLFQVDVYNYKPRILFADGLTDGEWRHDGLDLTQYPKVFFVRPGEARLSLAFGQENVYGVTAAGTVERYHKARLRRVEDATLLRLGIRFGDDELISLDMRKPVYLNDGFDDRWYYIMEIKQKRFGVDEYTEVELIQV